ncbi:hypothetical protein [Streptomyces cyaneofuscatus]|uniref:hypothetical protein n=1 Tax=Streptomyces cyaneofuscatus TaxID=66883 RepID=UPI003631EEEB
MNVSPDPTRPDPTRPDPTRPDPITTQDQVSQERDTLLDLFARGLICTAASAVGADHGEPSEEALTKARAVADDYLAAYEEWLVKIAATNAAAGPQ